MTVRCSCGRHGVGGRARARALARFLPINPARGVFLDRRRGPLTSRSADFTIAACHVRHIIRARAARRVAGHADRRRAPSSRSPFWFTLTAGGCSLVLFGPDIAAEEVRSSARRRRCARACARQVVAARELACHGRRNKPNRTERVARNAVVG